MLAKRQNFRHISIGDMRRSAADALWLSIYDFNVLWSQPWNEYAFDREFDDFQRNLSLDEGIVMDSRLGYYNIPQSYKVFLTIDSKIAAQRIFMDKRDSDNFEDVYKNLEMIELRNEHDKIRYQKLYNTDPWNLSNYDLVIDTWDKDIEEVYGIVWKSLYI